MAIRFIEKLEYASRKELPLFIKALAYDQLVLVEISGRGDSNRMEDVFPRPEDPRPVVVKPVTGMRIVEEYFPNATSVYKILSETEALNLLAN